MSRASRLILTLTAVLALLGGVGGITRSQAEKVQPKAVAVEHEWELPHLAVRMPFKDEQPIYFVNRGQDAAGWDALKAFWNPTTEKSIDPRTREVVLRKAVKIKVPLGLNANPPVPIENPMTVAGWKLGKKLYFDEILSSNKSVSCASCHDPKKGFTDQSPVSTGIHGKKGGMSAPTVFNSAYNAFQFWDGRAATLEHQAQGPVQNDVEMFSGDGHAWRKAVERLRGNQEYVKQFKQVFGSAPTQDATAKAIATYERTILSGNSIHDRADLAMRKRVDAEETGKYDLKVSDYARVLKPAFSTKDVEALKALNLDPARDEGKIPAVAKRLVNGRTLFFTKARCNGCHVGDNFTDNTFHNLGVGVGKDGKIPRNGLGRYAAAPTGHKNPLFVGAFKTPTLRHLLGTGPYMHDGSEKTLEQVIDFYDRGGNANEYLDVRMRDEDAESAWYKAKVKNPKVQVFNGKPIVPFKLNLTKPEKEDLILFLRSLQGDPADPIVAFKSKMPD